ncbi:Uncharacterized protein CGCA056_v013074 [Colletotrichum aenigma]|uniref:Uncharacterized protein n=1 Tax=Colletotrichum aenigma TaxID=1215731 RepID=UPI001872C1F7|nr:Uncharacterized protein CGCA056_v013074 [Colletotrichum aenigma]KAF5507478.1 Uncharacterized protein CGCA056_v013074 [Colletotrichum aenigma]
MAPMRILISGGGISGTSLAFWLSKLGHDITVVEWFPTLRATGLQLDLRGHGIEVMKRMGLEQAFRAKSAPEQGLQIVDSSGRRRAYFPANTSGKGLQSFTTEYEIMRGDLCRIIYDATKNRAKYVVGTSVEKFEQMGNRVEVLFSNGDTDTFDLLVGADGQGSRTRKMMLGAKQADGFEPLGGSYAGYFTVPKPIQEGEGYNATAYIGTNNRTIMTRRHSPDQTQIYLMCRTDSEEIKNTRREGLEKQKEAMARVFDGAGWETKDILGRMMKSTDFYCEHIGLVKMNGWSKGNVTLVGDAAYCPSVMTGMGTTSAVVGAYVLAGEIGKHCGDKDSKDGLGKALSAYEQKFRPFMDQVQHGISGNAFIWKIWPTTPFGIGILNFLLGLVSLLRLNVLGEWLLKENVKWELPEYEEMGSMRP